MSVVLRLDDSVIQVAPTLTDVEAVLVVRTFRQDPLTGGTKADGSVRRIVTNGSRKGRTRLPQQEVGLFSETSIGPFDRDQPSYETRSFFTVGGCAPVQLTMDRKVFLGVRWYGKDSRYLELRIRVQAHISELVANRGMGPFHAEEGEGFNFLGQFRRDEWVELHYDNHAHVGVSMVIRTDPNGFDVWPAPGKLPPNSRTRFDKILG